MRKYELVVGQVYHVFTKSIAEFKIFNNKSSYRRMIEVMRYYQKKPLIKFSRFIKSQKIIQKNFKKSPFNDKEKLVEIIAYCLMPTHLHLILKQLKENSISIFMSNILNSYTRYFNTKHKRKGPLWEGRFKNVLIENDEQLLHLTRYIHLNPITAYLVGKPEDWFASSYKEYLLEVENEDRLCNYNEILEINPKLYKEFVEDRVSYQRELARTKSLILE